MLAPSPPTNNGPVTIANTGQLTLSGNLNTSGTFGQTTSSGTILLSGTITSANAIYFTAPVITSGSPSLTTTNNNINFFNTVDGPGNLTLNSGAFDITFSANIGSNTPLGNLLITNVDNLSMTNLIAASFVQLAGTGTTTATGTINTSNSTGINLTGNNLTLNALNTTGGGPVTLDHTGTLTLVAGNSLLTGPFSELGGGPVFLQGTIHAEDSLISFTDPTTLTGSTALISNSGGDIDISNTIDGPQDIALQAGTGNILITANLGSLTPLNSFTINSANNVTTQDITAGCITQVAGTGLTTINGTLTSIRPCGIILTGNQFTLNAPLVTTMNGPVQITNSGLLIIAASPNLTGSFSQLGTGNTSLGANITTSSGNPILFTGPVTLATNITLNTGAGLGNITFLNTLDGDQILTLDAGGGNITLGAPVGSVTPTRYTPNQQRQQRHRTSHHRRNHRPHRYHRPHNPQRSPQHHRTLRHHPQWIHLRHQRTHHHRQRRTPQPHQYRHRNPLPNPQPQPQRTPHTNRLRYHLRRRHLEYHRPTHHLPSPHHPHRRPRYQQQRRRHHP